MKRLLVLSAALLLGLGARGAQAQLYQAPFGPGGTWNLYELEDAGAQWYFANEDANERTHQGIQGHLVDISSPEENGWVYYVFGFAQDPQIDDLWIGLTDREGAAPVATSGGLPAPQESAALDDPLRQGWAWTSGQPFTYHNWVGEEPNNSGGEDVAHIEGGGSWNDHKSGWFEDEPVEPDLQPGTSTDETGGPSYAYVIEYPTQRATEFPGIPYPVATSLWPTGAGLPGVDGAVGTMGVTDYRGDFTADGGGALIAILPEIVANPDNFDAFPAQFPKADAADPDTNPEGGPALSGTPLPFPSDVYTGPSDNGEDDNDVITVGKATILVPETDTYTIQVHSDEGFGLRVVGTRFKAEYGDGQLDGADGSLIHPDNTGDSNTRGVIELKAGKHDIEFAYWDRDGGAYWEISSAQGDVGASGNAQWLALGDGTVLPDNKGLWFVQQGASIPGDFNDDGQLTVTDIDMLTQASASHSDPPEYDLNNDSLVNVDDVNVWAHDLKKTWIGDADVNQEFNSSDLVRVFVSGRYETGLAAVWSEGDWNGSGVFDSADMVAAFVDGGYEQGPRTDGAAVPEPGGWLLLLLAAVSMLTVRRRA